MTARNVIGRIRIPSDMVLTPILLLGAIRKLGTREIRRIIHALIGEVDERCGDPDFEADSDLEDDPDFEVSAAEIRVESNLAPDLKCKRTKKFAHHA